jgi:uncharacterized cofD-like protein
MKKIVLIGGGTGVAELVAEFKKISGVQLTAVVTVFDDGGSTGRLRRESKIPAVGDLRKVVSASLDTKLATILEKRPKGGHPLGNLLLAFLTKKFGLAKAVRVYSKITGATVEVLPVSFDSAQLVSELRNCRLIGEAKLDQPPARLKNQKIYRVSLEPAAKLNPAVGRALKTADKIIVGPGSLFGSLLANFAVQRFARTFEAASAKKILVLNACSDFGARGESLEEVTQRFGVSFDQVLRPAKNARRWKSQSLVLKILK